MLGFGANKSPARTNSPAVREPAAILERPEPLIVEAKVIDRYQSYDAWRSVSLCSFESSLLTLIPLCFFFFFCYSLLGVSAEGVDITPLNDSTARVRVLYPSIKGASMSGE